MVGERIKEFLLFQLRRQISSRANRTSYPTFFCSSSCLLLSRAFLRSVPPPPFSTVISPILDSPPPPSYRYTPPAFLRAASHGMVCVFEGSFMHGIISTLKIGFLRRYPHPVILEENGRFRSLEILTICACFLPPPPFTKVMSLLLLSPPLCGGGGCSAFFFPWWCRRIGGGGTLLI